MVRDEHPIAGGTVLIGALEALPHPVRQRLCPTNNTGLDVTVPRGSAVATLAGWINSARLRVGHQP